MYTYIPYIDPMGFVGHRDIQKNVFVGGTLSHEIIKFLLEASESCNDSESNTLGIQSYCRRMIGVSNHLLSKVSTFHAAILRR